MKKKLKDLYNQFPPFGRFSGVIAASLDKMELEENRSFFSRMVYGLRKRARFVLFFPALVALDIIFSLAGAVLNFFGALFTADHLQNKFLKQSQEYAFLFSKSLIGLIASPLGLISPKLVSFMFIPAEKKANEIKSGGSLYKAMVEKIEPTEIEEVRAIIHRANKEGRTVMAVGAGRSQGRQFLPHSNDAKKPSLLIDMSAFNHVNVNLDTQTVTVGAGAKWHEVQMAANQHKLALKVMQASNVFSVGGSIGTNIHGWDHRSGNLAQIIHKITIINADGEIETLDRLSPKFGCVIGGYGAFGIVINAEIELTKNENLKEKGTLVSIEDYVQHFRQHVEPNPDIRMHLFRLSLDPNNLLSEGIAVDFQKTDGKQVKTTQFHPEGKNGTRMDRILVNVARRVGSLRKKYWDGEKDRLLTTETVMTTNEIMQPPINAMFNNSASEAEWLQEFFIPQENIAVFVRELGQLLTKNQVALLNSSIRFVKQDKISLLSYAAGGDRFAVVLCFNQSLKHNEVVKTKKWVREANDLVIKHGGSFYLPYQQFASQEQFAQSYPQFAAFHQEKQTIDQNGLFNSGLYEQYLENKDTKTNHLKILLENPERRKKFAGFLENVLQRVDTDKFYELLEDIVTYNDTHEDIYKELIHRLPEIMPGMIGSLRKILGSLNAIKKDLGQQAKELLAGIDKIDGLVEIGYPGRFVNEFTKAFNVTGTITAVYEAQSVTDYVQTGFPRPYDRFVKLDYNLPNLSVIPNNSADVITCYVGLHHFPTTELDKFLTDLRRILRNDGQFLLVEHDVQDQESHAMASMAHSIFNAVTGASVEEEMTELRNFHSLAHWKQLLISHGFEVDVQEGQAMVRNGDPSLNTMISFKKPQPNPLAKLGGSARPSERFEVDSPTFGPLFASQRQQQPTAVVKELAGLEP